MSYFVIIELYKKFISEGMGSELTRKKIKEHTGATRKYIYQVIRESPECQELSKQRRKQHDEQRKLAGGVPRWN